MNLSQVDLTFSYYESSAIPRTQCLIETTIVMFSISRINTNLMEKHNKR